MRALPGLLGVLPLLFVPVVGDAFQTALIAQEARTGGLDFRAALRDALGVFRVLALLKLEFELVAFLWGIVPVYGALRGMRERLHWAMASNVVLLEGLGRDEARERCRELAAGATRFMLRTLVIVPTVLSVTALVVALTVASYFERGAAAIWTFVVVTAWIVFPASGAVNTILYRTIVESPEFQRSEPGDYLAHEATAN